MQHEGLVCGDKMNQIMINSSDEYLKKSCKAFSAFNFAEFVSKTGLMQNHLSLFKNDKIINN